MAWRCRPSEADRGSARDTAQLTEETGPGAAMVTGCGRDPSKLPGRWLELAQRAAFFEAPAFAAWVGFAGWVGCVGCAGFVGLAACVGFAGCVG